MLRKCLYWWDWDGLVGPWVAVLAVHRRLWLFRISSVTEKASDTDLPQHPDTPGMLPSRETFPDPL